MGVAGNNFPGISDFHKELINRFFNPKSYFIFSFINELKTHEALLENPENVAIIGLVVDEIINAPDKIETLFNLTRIPGFDVFYHTLMEKVEYLRVTHLTTNQMMETVKELGISLAITFTSMMTRADSKNELLSYAGLKKTKPTPFSPPKEPSLQESPPDRKEPTGETRPEPMKKPVEPSGVEDLFQKGPKGPEPPDPWDFFTDDVNEKLDEIDHLLEDFQTQRHNRSLLKKVKIAFQELREWAMIQGNEGIEAISMRTLGVLNLALRTFGFPLEKVLPDVGESVEALREVNRSGWAGENLDIVPVVLHRLEKLYKDVEEIAQSESTSETAPETHDVADAFSEDNPPVEPESDFEWDEEFDQHSLPQDQMGDESDEIETSRLLEETGLSEGFEEGPLFDEESVTGDEESSHEDSKVAEPEDSGETVTEEKSADAEEVEIPTLADSDFSVSEMEKLYEEMFPQEDAVSESVSGADETIPAGADESSEPQVEETETEDAPLGEISNETFILSELDEDKISETVGSDESDALSLPGEDDEDLLQVIDELAGELPSDSPEPDEQRPSEQSRHYHTNLLGSEDDQAVESADTSDAGTPLQKGSFSESEHAPLIMRGGKDFVEEAEMYFQFAKRAFSLFKKDANNHRAYEDVELACYSLKILARKLGYEYVTRIVDRIETIFKKILSRELLLKEENISYISDVVLELEKRGKQNRLADKEVYPWASDVLSTLASFEEHFLNKKMESKKESHDSEAEEPKDPLEFLMYDDTGKYFKQLLNE
ncbi:MAG: hypothetical protein GXO76_11845 [Calditrichaeota bacterium]|nr:hypothetical protein [Calditrichota bacterium]